MYALQICTAWVRPAVRATRRFQKLVARNGGDEMDATKAARPEIDWHEVARSAIGSAFLAGLIGGALHVLGKAIEAEAAAAVRPPAPSPEPTPTSADLEVEA